MSVKISELTAWVAALSGDSFPVSIAGTTYKIALTSYFAPLTNAALTGNPTATTQSTSDNSTRIATTEFVKTNLGNYLPLIGGTITGDTVFSATGVLNFDNNIHLRTGGILLFDSGSETRNSGLHTFYTGTTWDYQGSSAANHIASLGIVSNATHTGDATGATALTVVKINGTLMSGLATGILKNTTGTGVPSIATAGTDYYNPGGTDVAVADGGTGRSTGTTAYALIATGTTATGAQQTLANGATTEILVGGGASALPVWTSASGSGAPVRAISPTLTGTLNTAAIIDTQTALGTTPTDGTLITNTSSASLGAQQYSPALSLLGSGWATGGSSSMTVKYRNYVVPVQGSSAPSGLLTWDSSIAGGGAVTQMTLSSAGALTLTGTLTGTSFNAGNFSASNTGILMNNGTSALVSWGGNTILTYGGAVGNLRQGTADVAAPVAQTFSVQNVVAGTSNTAGADRTFSGSQGTGTGVGGAHIFKVAPAGSTGSTQNALVSSVTFPGSGGLTFGDGLGAFSQLKGPTDQALTVAATAPVQQTGATAGNALTLLATDAVAGSSTVGAAAGGAVTITAGSAQRLTSGGASGGAVTISSGSGINGNTGGVMTLQTLGTTWPAGAMNLTSGQGGAINIVSSDVSGGNAIGAITIKPGANSSASSGPVAGGSLFLTTQAGGAHTLATGTGGAGGLQTITLGTGGLAPGTTAATGGAGGAWSVIGGTGGAATGAGGTQLGGAGSSLSMTAGTGGAATSASGTRTGGAGGAITQTTGTGGAGSTTNGNGGDYNIVTGAGGAGGGAAGTTGAFIVKPGNTEQLKVATTGVTIGQGTAITKVLSATATLDYDLTSLTLEDKTITVTGAALGDVVSVGVPNGSVTATSVFTAWVSAADTVTVRCKTAAVGENPASGTFRVMVTKF
jgi:hypothetical protein